MAVAALLTAPHAGARCADTGTALCLQGDRFRVEVTWTDFEGGSGVGHAVPLTPDTGYFWFFRDTNVELVVKVLDGRPVNGHFWVFYGALSNVSYEVTVTDTATGVDRTYPNPAGRFASRGDTRAFPGAGPAAGSSPAALGLRDDRPGVPAPVSPPLLRRASRAGEPTTGRSGFGRSRTPGPTRVANRASAATARLGSPPCSPSPTVLCLRDGDFRAEVEWEDFAGGSGLGRAVPLPPPGGGTTDSGYFWFFRDTNVELVVKVLDGRPVNGRFWVFYGSLSSVPFRLTVTDTRTGVRRTYTNPAGTLASRGDTSGLPGRPVTGFGLSPRYFASIDRNWTSEESLRAFFAELEALGVGVWAVNGHWYDLLERDGRLLPGLDQLLTDYPGVRSRIVAAVQFVELESGLPRLAPGSGRDATWEAWRADGGWEDLTEAAVRIAERQQAPFLSVGVEINRFARFFPGPFAHFAGTVYPQIVERVRAVSPDTVVFPGFQFEWTVGDLRGSVGPGGEPGCPTCVPPADTNSLSGRSHPAMGDVLNLFPPDALSHVGFTTYPYFNRDFATPADLPADYYTRLYDQLDAAHQGVELVFTETGWPANAELTELEACVLCTLLQPDAEPTCHPQVVPAAPCDAARLAELRSATADWLGGEDEQAAWARRFRELTAPLSPALTLWAILHDADPRNPAALAALFTHTGLRTHDGSHNRPAWEVWREEWAP